MASAGKPAKSSSQRGAHVPIAVDVVEVDDADEEPMVVETVEDGNVIEVVQSKSPADQGRNITAIPSKASSSGSSSSESSAEHMARVSAETKHNLPLRSAHCSRQGIRPSMEDEVTQMDVLTIPGDVGASYKDRFSLYAVFDGHGGTGAAKYAKKTLHTCVADGLAKGMSPADALTSAYSKTDSEFLAIAANPKDSSGTTAVTCLVDRVKKTLWIANAGDSRAVLGKSDGTAVALSTDHKPDLPTEMARIRDAGGFVIHKRIMGELAVSRAIGDLDFKGDYKLVSSQPDIREIAFTDKDRFVLLACDGLYDVMSNDEAVTWISGHLDSHAGFRSLDFTCQELVRHCIKKLETRDNCSVVIIALQ